MKTVSHQSAKYLFRKLVSVLCLLLFSISMGQESTVEELLSKSYEYDATDCAKALYYSEKAIDLAEQSGTSEQKVKAYIKGAYDNFYMSNSEKSFYYARKGLEQKEAQNNDLYKADLYIALGANYYFYELYELSYKKFYEAVDLLIDKKDLESRSTLLKVYNFLIICNYVYEDLNLKNHEPTLNIIKKGETLIRKYSNLNEIEIANFYMSYGLHYYYLNDNELNFSIYDETLTLLFFI